MRQRAELRHDAMALARNYFPFFVDLASVARSFTVGNGGAGYDPSFSCGISLYSLTQKSGGPSLSATLFFMGLSPRFKYAAIAQSSSSDMCLHDGHGIGGAR